MAAVPEFASTENVRKTERVSLLGPGVSLFHYLNSPISRLRVGLIQALGGNPPFRGGADMSARWFGSIVALAATGAALAQSPAPPIPASRQATAIGSAEINEAIQLNKAGALADSVLRVVPIEAGYNIGVSVVRRSQVDGKTPPDAIVHDAITEVYQIIEGNGVLVTGGTLESPTPFPNDGPVVRQGIGPSAFGKVILGGTRHRVGPGDVVVIPPHTAHGFEEISTKRIVYTLIRIDSQQILELRSKSD